MIKLKLNNFLINYNFYAVAQPIYLCCDGVVDSGKEKDLCGVCGGDNSSCTDCQGRIRPGFVNNNTCGMFPNLCKSVCYVQVCKNVNFILFTRH